MTVSYTHLNDPVLRTGMNTFLENGLTGNGGSWMTGFDWNSMGWDWGAMTPSHWGLFAINAFEEIYVADGFIASLIVIAAYFWYKWDFALKALLATCLLYTSGINSGNTIEQGSFTAARSAHDADKFSFIDRETDIIYGFGYHTFVAVVFFYITYI